MVSNIKLGSKVFLMLQVTAGGIKSTFIKVQNH